MLWWFISLSYILILIGLHLFQLAALVQFSCIGKHIFPLKCVHFLLSLMLCHMGFILKRLLPFNVYHRSAVSIQLLLVPNSGGKYIGSGKIMVKGN